MVDFAAGHPVGKMGWGTINETTNQKRSFEARFRDAMIAENPTKFEMRETKALKPGVLAAWDKLQKDCGRIGNDSCDMSLLIYLAFKKRWKWWPQDIGSCVWSNTWRIIILRMIYEIGLRGDPEEYFGRSEAGQFSIAPHAVTYGFAREIANMKGGDGLYASPMAKALSRGMIMCSTPKLMELSKAAGADKPANFPEPRNPGLYRRIGDWAWNDALRPYLTCPITELPPVTDYVTHVALQEAGKPIFQCASIAIKKVGKHKDGFTIHERDPNNSWAHNMGHVGHFYDSKGDRWHRFANLSWLNDPNPEAVNDEFDNYEYSESGLWVPKKPFADNPDPLPNWDDEIETYIYNIRADHLEGWYKQKLVDSYAIGEMDMPDSGLVVV